MNTQNNEYDRLVNLLAEKSHDDITHVIQTHLKNRFGDQEVIDAVIDYASALAQSRSQLANDGDSGDGLFTYGKKIGGDTISGDGLFTHGKKIGGDTTSDNKLFSSGNKIKKKN